MGERADSLTSSGAAVAKQLAANLLRSFDENTKAQPRSPLKDKRTQRSIPITALHLTPKEEQATIFNEILAKSDLYDNRYASLRKVLNPYAWNDLHLFCGTTATPAYHFLSRINKTITAVGESLLASLLSAPTANYATLTKRQQLIALLNQETTLYSDLKNQLKIYKESENRLLSFWTKTDPLYSKEYGDYLSKLFYYKDHHIAMNKDAGRLQARKLWLRDFGNIYSKFVFFPLVGSIVGELGIWLGFPRSLWYERCFPGSIPIWGFLHTNKWYHYYGAQRGYPSGINHVRNALYLLCGYVMVHSFWFCYRGYKNYQAYAAVLKNLALRMADVQIFLTTIKKINSYIAAHPQLETLYGEQFSASRKLLARVEERSEVGNLLRYLLETPFHPWPYLSGHAGKLLASYKLFVEHKAIFHDSLYELGQLDALLSIVTLMQERHASGASHSYTFTNLLPTTSHDDKPYLEIKGMWNPMLEPALAVGNDLVMGMNGTQTVVLTGPNAGGKSTFLTGVTYVILLSQTFGIAPTQACALTPFRYINTYIDVTDDIASGKSLFMAEVMRFQDHLNRLRLLKRHEYSFTIFDEPFSGTNPDEGAAAEYSILNHIADYTNTLNIVATHYPLVMFLEDYEVEKGFKNYKVLIKQQEKGAKIGYTYKVLPGKSNQTIAIDILEEQGYSIDMLQQAKDILANPGKYQKKFSDVT